MPNIRHRKAIAPLCALLALLLMMVACLAAPATAFAEAGSDASGRAGAAVLTTTDGGAGAVVPVVDGADGSVTDGSGSDSIAGPVPNVIITNFSYGDGSVPVGGSFTLGFTFQNMGQVAVSNMVVTVDGGESFAIAGGTNTFYVDSLWAGYTMTQSLPMQAVSSAQSGAQPITVSFRYEYVDGGMRSSNSSDIKISVPVSQPDRFQVNDPVVPDVVNAGEETTVTMEYVNKGKGDISNVEAAIEGDGVDAAVRTQYLGNVASGATGQIGFAFTPLSVGSTEVKLRVSYEDSDGQSQSKEFPLTLDVQEAMPIDDGMIDDGMIDDGMIDEPRQGPAWWVWAIVAVAVAAAVVLVVMLARRRKRKAGKHADIDEEWDDWANGDAASGSAVPVGTVGEPGAADSADGTTTQVIADLPSAVAPRSAGEPSSAGESGRG
ncbi:ABC transporter permease [Bifidobacterium lemurum]|uniref:ABC transporter permease n=1 Tax=Bifidobacterium lemurum TaxID=1603886 RepID=A0A261FST8_9BIFI|nr:ABC transporter permease [Bifidobacterium lemurum]OZG62217.1 ABC transporter permease [Bifidobacterium lemurum]